MLTKVVPKEKLKFCVKMGDYWVHKTFMSNPHLIEKLVNELLVKVKASKLFVIKRKIKREVLHVW